jgi:uncharacterized Zn finger protein (UPF0148 family)
MCPNCRELGTSVKDGRVVCHNCGRHYVEAEWKKAGETRKAVIAERKAQEPPAQVTRTQ